MKLNLGCGTRRMDGYVNVDAQPECEPDQVWDLEQTPWPWADNSVEHVVMSHVLEHLGRDPKVFIEIIRELYRIMIPGGVVQIVVPHPRHDDYLADPTHVRPILPETLKLFDRSLNDQWKVMGLSNTPLAHYSGVDFFLKSSRVLLEDEVYEAFKAGRLDKSEVDRMVKCEFNIAKAFRFELVARKT